MSQMHHIRPLLHKSQHPGSHLHGPAGFLSIPYQSKLGVTSHPSWDTLIDNTIDLTQDQGNDDEAELTMKLSAPIQKHHQARTNITQKST